MIVRKALNLIVRVENERLSPDEKKQFLHDLFTHNSTYEYRLEFVLNNLTEIIQNRLTTDSFLEACEKQESFVVEITARTRIGRWFNHIKHNIMKIFLA